MADVQPASNTTKTAGKNEVENQKEAEGKMDNLTSSSIIKKILTNITVEPVVFLYFIGVLMANVITQSLIIRKFCIIQMDLPDETCRNLTSNRTLETEAQGYANNFVMYKTILDTLPTALWGLFIGSWSDKFGRKALLIIPNIGAAIGMVILALNAYYEEQLDVTFILFSSVALALSGNMLVLNTGAFSYIADITTPQQRIHRFAILTAALLCGAPVGMSCGGLIFKFFDYKYEPVFIISTIIFILNVLYVICFVKESVIVENNEKNKYLSFFNIQNIKDVIKTITIKRENNGRRQLIILTLIIAIIFMPLYAEHNLTFMYTRLKFKWDEVMFSNFTTVQLVFNFLGLMLCLPLLSKLLKLKDTTIGVISSTAKVMGEIIIGVSVEGWMLFAVSPMYLVGGLTGTIVKTMVSNIVSPSEQGKISSVMGIAEGIVPTIGSFILTPLYEATKDTDFPGAIYFFNAGLTVIPICFLTSIYFQKRKIVKQEPIVLINVINVTPA